jgi:pectin methylesterase-like acyl-CoA thioesterase
MSGMTLAMKLLVISLILIHCIPLHSLSHEAAADPLQITVDAVKGHDNSSCSTNQIPCATLSYASKVLQKQQQERNILYIKRGEYNLTVRIEMSRRTSIEIIGLSTSQQVQIICSNNVGLAFAYMKNVSISNITLLGCGIQKVSSSVNTTDKQFLNYFVSLYIINCATINISHVHVNNSIGTGVTIYNPNTVQVTGSVIANSLLSERGRSTARIL